MTKENVVLKGTKDGVRVILANGIAFNELFEEIIVKFENAKTFFSDGKCNINFEGRYISESDKLRLERKIQQVLPECKITVSYIETKVEPSEQKSHIFSDIKEGYTKFHEGTIRSGRLIQSEGNLVVLGDINPGAEVVAAGNIVVMGAVRGIVHAGCTGNREAFIVALNLSPTQIRIADIITRPPDDDDRKTIVPEKAYIKDENIYIDEYLTK